MLSSKRHLIEYQVCHGEWAYVETGNEIKPSDTLVDDRTVRVRTFETEGDALTYAREYLSRHNDPWLAYLEIKKCETEVIRILK